jgi:hypothetical protein
VRAAIAKTSSLEQFFSFSKRYHCNLVAWGALGEAIFRQNQEQEPKNLQIAGADQAGFAMEEGNPLESQGMSSSALAGLGVSALRDTQREPNILLGRARPQVGAKEQSGRASILADECSLLRYGRHFVGLIRGCPLVGRVRFGPSQPIPFDEARRQILFRITYQA